LLILLAILILFGAKKIPELAQGLGKGIREFRKAIKETKEEIEKPEEEAKPDKKNN
ncbi:MAG: preprotein translocase subunit TatA, partial [candidate division Zixibacteria bacterium RBG_16_48_11]